MLRKYGIALITLVVAIVIITIISAVTVVSVNDTISETNFKTFVMELYTLQKLVDNYKMKNNGKLDFTTYTVKAKDYTGELKDVLETEGEIKREETVFYLLDENALEKLAIDKLTYGNQKYDETDIYAVSGTSGRVYYLYGYDFKETRYYYLTDGIITDIVLPNLDSEIASEILFIPSEFGKTREAVKVSVKVPRTVDISTVSVTTPGNSNPVISSYTMEGNYYVYTVNTNNWKGNYIVNVDYVENSENKTASYSVEEYLGVYALLYSDGELRINNTGKIDEAKIQAGNTVLLQSTDITDSTTIPWSSNATNITKVTFENRIIPNYVKNWFNGCTNLTVIEGLELVDTENITDMSYMFNGCTNLIQADVGSFDTSNVTNMSFMFYNCNSLEEIDVSNFKTQKVTNMKSMFRACSRVEEIDVSSFDTSKLKWIDSMFKDCTNLKTLDLSNFYAPKLTSMSYTFQNCKNLETLNLKGFYTPNSISLGSVFADCWKLKSLDLSGITKVTSLNNTFMVCKALENVDLSHMTISNADMTYTFIQCSNIKEVKFPENVSIKSLYATFLDCSKLTSVNMGSFDTSSVTDMRNCFNGCAALKNLDVSKWNTGSVTKMYGAFMGCQVLENIDVSKWNTESVTDMSQMFQNCYALKEIDASSWITTNLTKINQMFYNSAGLTYIDFRNADFSNVTNYAGIFNGVLSEGTIVAADDTQKSWIKSLLPINSKMVVKKVSEL